MLPIFHHVGNIRPNPAWHRRQHTHEHDEIVPLFRGKMTVLARNASVAVEAGDVLFYPRGLPHEEFSDRFDPVEFYFVGFTGDETVAQWPLVVKDVHGRVRLLTSWLHTEQNAHTPLGRLVQKTFLDALISEMVRIQTHLNLNMVERIRHFMREHIAQPLTLGRLAQEAKVSKFHFLRQYRKLCGRTPMEDLRHLRVEFARNLVLTSNLPLKVIAPMTGLGDEYNLSRTFRKCLGMCPSRLRSPQVV